MRHRAALLAIGLVVLAAAAWLGRAGQDKGAAWTEVAPGVLRSPGPVAGYALIDGDRALLIDAPVNADGLGKHGVKQIAGVLLTHYHRDACAAIGDLIKGVPVRAPKKAADWLSPDGVRKYWKESIPLRGSRTAYLVVPEGFDGIEYSLTDGQRIDWQGWKLEVIDTPGHALVHVAIAAQKKDGRRVVFCGGAFAAAGKVWAPYTTDWDHWTDAGLKPAAESLRKLIALKADILCPAHGPVIGKDALAALTKTLAAVEEAGFLKSFERFSKKRLGNPPEYRFLAKEQAESNGSKPWTKVSDHIWLTGNTYILTSKDNVCLMFDPWGKRSADQFAKLQADQKLGPLEVVMFSHAHFDHYDGIYELPGRNKFEVWALDTVAKPIAEPDRWRAPFIDARPVKFDRKPRDGDTLRWREYTFRFRHLPGQSLFTMGVETAIDGKRCFFTADNFFHQDMFSGSGGWMGLNRSFPPLYSKSAKIVLDAAPEWVLAEHGGPFEFSAEDFRRRVLWGEAAAKALDALSPTGDHQRDWNPSRVHVEPLVRQSKPGAELTMALVVENPGERADKVNVTLNGRGLIADQTFVIEAPARGEARKEFRVRLPERLAEGRHVITLRATRGEVLDGSDAFFAVDVRP